ncbi:MAG: hypothetical protein IBJ11_11015, partial [Phycisphaerales bacterium]|nr:hypothetical protein [Phycisphaerales bacterium]
MSGRRMMMAGGVAGGGGGACCGAAAAQSGVSVTTGGVVIPGGVMWPGSGGFPSFGGGGVWTSGGIYYRPWWDRSPCIGCGAQSWTLLELARRLDPQLVDPSAMPGAGPAAPVPPRDEALVAFRARDYERAVGEYTSRAAAQREAESLSTAESPVEVNRGAQRMLALALAAAGQFARAERELEDAYAADPSLGSRRVHGEMIFASGEDLRDLTALAVRRAQLSAARSSWFLAAVLTQAEGRDDDARRLLSRSREAREGGGGAGPGVKAVPG